MVLSKVYLVVFTLCMPPQSLNIVSWMLCMMGRRRIQGCPYSDILEFINVWNAIIYNFVVLSVRFFSFKDMIRSTYLCLELGCLVLNPISGPNKLCNLGKLLNPLTLSFSVCKMGEMSYFIKFIVRYIVSLHIIRKKTLTVN